MWRDFKGDVVIYGAGFEAERFEYIRGGYNPIYYIDRNAGRTFHGRKVYTLEEKINDLKGRKILVAASKTSYGEISKLLEDVGFVEFEDFISIHYLDRQMIILYGNCHMQVIEQYLCQQVELLKKYFVRRYHVGDKEIPRKNDIEHCSIFIGQDIAEKNGMNVPGVQSIIDILPKECTHIVIPNLHGYTFLWPQVVKESLDNIENLHIGEDRIPVRDINNNQLCSQAVRTRHMIGWRDCYIEKCMEDGMPIDDIIYNCMNKDVFNEEKIKNCFSDAMRKLKLREQDCDIKISDYIEQNYQTEELFYDPGHPTNILLKEITRRILNEIGIDEIEFLETGISLDFMEIFIYGCVKKALGLKYEKKYMRRNESFTSLWGQPITVAEYIEQYALWSKK